MDAGNVQAAGVVLNTDFFTNYTKRILFHSFTVCLKRNRNAGSEFLHHARLLVQYSAVYFLSSLPIFAFHFTEKIKFNYAYAWF